MNSLANFCEDVAAELGGDAQFAAITCMDEVGSTSSELKRRLSDGTLSRCTLLATDYQSEGRGTHGRGWLQQRGRDIALTIAVPPGTPGFDEPRLPLISGAVVAISLEAAVPLAQPNKPWVRLSWPNDICLGDPPLKTGGILVESSRGWVFLGVGINLNSEAGTLQAQVGQPVTSVSGFLGGPVDRRQVYSKFVASLLKTLGLADGSGLGMGGANLLGMWVERDATAGKRYRLASTNELVTAVAADIDSGGLRCVGQGGNDMLVNSYRELLPA